jgi:hypothetical protein
VADLLQLIEAQQRDQRFGDRIPPKALEILAGLNPYSLKAKRPRYFRSGRVVKRRRRSAEVTHGTTAMYKRGCRCDECRGEQTRRNREWKRQRRLALTTGPADQRGRGDS